MASLLLLALVVVTIPLAYLLERWNTLRRSPLNKLPGPWSAKWSNFTHSRRYLSGRQPYEMLHLHNKYGSVVRYAPNEVSFNTSSAARDIYAFRKGHQKFLKDHFYEQGRFAGQALSILTERDPEKHGVWRKQLSTAFSERNMRDIEVVLSKTVDKLVNKLRESVGDANGVDIDPMFNMVTFDVMGHMALGVDFDSVSKGKLHEWAVFLSAGVTLMSVHDTMLKFPVLGRIAKLLLSKRIGEMNRDKAKHEQFTINIVEERLKDETPTTDFISHAITIQRQAKVPVPKVQIAAIASDLVIAGTETSATALAAIFYYLVAMPGIMTKLRAELNAAFTSYDEINAAALVRLEYLNAIITEGLRMYPPLPVQLVRLVPPGGDTVDGIFLPGGTVVSASPFGTNYSPKNFHDPWKFKPERWTDPLCTDDLEASRPFSIGTRNCIGQNLAWMEMRMTLAKLVYCFDFESKNPGLDWHGQSQMHTLWQNPPLDVLVKPLKA